jgi:prepilin-type N-terminal cleavage/methylation domain-containing protein/prepilin-type processing-associated H-X9-DG protein
MNAKRGDGKDDGGRRGTDVRGFTLTELVVALAALVVIAAVLLSLSETESPRGISRQTRDSSQVHQIIRAVTTWSISNKDMYPLPSQLDRNNSTVAGPKAGEDQARHASKDNTGNMLSILIWNGSITPELCVSSAEVSQKVRSDDSYETLNPSACRVNGGKDAQWDPGFSGTADAEEGQGDEANTPRRVAGISNNSYAHALMLDGTARGKNWMNTFVATQALLGNRGPLYAGADAQSDVASGTPAGGWKLADGPLGKQSNTLAIHGGRSTWEGNIGYNDGHVTFETRPDPVETTYRVRGKSGKVTVTDNMFVDEADEETAIAGSATAAAAEPLMVNTNNWLRPIARVKASSGPDGKPRYQVTRWVD